MSRSSDTDTEELLDRVRGGDSSAVEQLFARQRPRLRRMVAVRQDKRLAGRVDPSDVVQEALATAYKRLPEYLDEPSVAFYPWLRQIAWDRLMAAYRRHLEAGKRAVGQEVAPQLSDDSAMELAEQLAATGTGPLEHLLREEVCARVRAILEELPETDREILVLKHLEELTNAECGNVVGISVVAVKKRYLRALRRLRELIHDDFR